MNSLSPYRWIAIVSVLVAPILAFIATQSETNTQDVHTWLPSGTEDRVAYDNFIELFGHDDDILVSWPGCTVEDPRLHEFTDRLHDQNAQSDRFHAILNGANVLDKLTGSRLGLREVDARRRLANVFLGPDGQTTGIVLQLSDVGRANRKASLNEVLREADQVEGLSAEEIRMGGSSYISSEIDKSTNRSLLLSIPAILLSVLITYLCLRSWRLSVITLWVAGLAALTSVALVTGCGYKINGLLVMMPVLVLVLTLSGCVHLCSYYKTVFCAQPNLPSIEHAKQAFAMGWRPSCMAMLTTSVGILMLSTSRIEAVQHFGGFSALSILIALGILLAVYPALLAIWPASERERQWLLANAKRQRTRRYCPVSFLPGRITAALILVAVAIVGPWAFMGLGKLQTTLSPTRMFPASSEVIRNYTWINQNWTSLESMEVLVKFPKDQGSLLEQMQTVSKVHGTSQRVEHVCSAFSVANLSPKISRRRTTRASIQRQALNGKLKDQMENLIAQRLIAEDDTSRVWRIRLGVKIKSDRDYESLVSGVRAKVDALSERLEDPPEVVLTGIWPLSAAGRHQLFNDLAYSFLMAFAIITPVVMLILRGVLVGLVAMIPNLAPGLMFFGTLGWLGWTIDIGTILTASVGLGIAVDDTLHFIEWYAREQKRTKCSEKALKATVAQCAGPMIFTTLICSSGLILFAFSEFIPPRQFAYAIVTLLGLALASDLLLLPALITGPLGFVFRSKKKRTPEPEPVILGFHADDQGDQAQGPERLPAQQRRAA